MAERVDILIVTVTEVESQAVVGAFQQATGREARWEALGEGSYADLGMVANTRVFLVLTGMGTGGVNGAQENIRKALADLSPAAVVMVGIAFGVNETKQKIGDVLVAESLSLYEHQRVGTAADGKSEIIPRGGRPSASAGLTQWLKAAALAKWSGARIDFGTILSGEKLMDNMDYREQLRRLEKGASGGEMEGAGLYAACHNAKVDWILVKAICDWADGKKHEDKANRQQMAVANAAAFVLHALQNVPRNWRQERCGKRHGEAPVPGSQEIHNSTVATNGSAIATGGGSAFGGVRDVYGDFIINPAPSSSPPPTTASPGSSRSRPSSSLPCQPHFFGRQKELAKIFAAISPEARTWGALIDGAGGVGKTALAIRAGHLAPAKDFDFKIFLSAKVRRLTPTGEQPLTDFTSPSYMEILKELALDLGEENIAKIAPDERPNTIRRALRDKRALIIFDNLETLTEAERIRLYQFLSHLPDACKAIVTSRRRDDIDARVIRLDRLEKPKALELLAALAEDNRHLQKASAAERAQLYETAQGNPLLIQWLVGQLGRPGSRCRTVAAACDFLHAAPAEAHNDPLEYIFGDLLETFSATEIAVLAVLGYFTQAVPVAMIAAVADIAVASAQTALEDLADRALLISDEEQNFFLPPLAAVFLRRKRPDIVAKTGCRLTDRAYALALENGYQNYERFLVLEEQWRVVAAALPHFSAGDNKRLQRVYDALNTFLNFTGRWDECLALSLEGEGRALAAGDFYSAGWRACQAGWIYFLRSQAAAIHDYAQRCAAHWEKAPSAGAREKAIAIRLRGVAYELEGNYPLAKENYREVLRLDQSIDPESGDVAVALNDIAGVEGNIMKDYAAAERNYREALRIAKKVNDREGIAICTGNLAELSLKCGRYVEAEALAREALRLAEAIGRQELIGYDCQRLAQALARQGKAAAGLPYAQRAVEIFTKLGMAQDLADAQDALQECQKGQETQES